MSTLYVHYDIQDGDFPRIISKIKEHLTVEEPPRGLNARLESLKDSLKSELDPFECVEFDLNRDHAPWIANALQFFDDDPSIDDLYDRYRVASNEGYLSLRIYGQKINRVGDHPMTVKMDGYLMEGLSHGLWVLESWYDCFKKDGLVGMEKKAAQTREKNKDVGGCFDAVLTSLPKTEEEFQEKIDGMKRERYSHLLHFAINMTRLYWDFIGKPIQGAGFSPIETQVKDGNNLVLAMSDEILDLVIKYPSVPLEEIAKVLNPPSDNHLLC